MRDNNPRCLLSRQNLFCLHVGRLSIKQTEPDARCHLSRFRIQSLGLPAEMTGKCSTPIMTIMILMVFLRHNANTVNNDGDDDGYDDDDDDDNDGAPSDGAGAVDAADDCGNEHVDKAP